MVKLNKAKMMILRFDKADITPGSVLEFETALLSHHDDDNCSERAKISSVTVETNVQHRRPRLSDNFASRRPVSVLETSRNQRNHRMSMPDMEKFELKTEKKPRERIRDSFKERAVGPPKQARYYCKTCKADVCNACFSSTCSAHNVQFLGSAYFHCASPYHKIQHDHNPM